MEIPTLVKILTTIKAIYTVRGFNIISIVADNSFTPMKDNLDFVNMNITLNVTSKVEHESYIDQFNLTLEERYRMCFAILPFKKIPHRIVVELVYL